MTSASAYPGIPELRAGERTPHPWRAEGEVAGTPGYRDTRPTLVARSRRALFRNSGTPDDPMRRRGPRPARVFRYSGAQAIGALAGATAHARCPPVFRRSRRHAPTIRPAYRDLGHSPFRPRARSTPADDLTPTLASSGRARARPGALKTKPMGRPCPDRARSAGKRIEIVAGIPVFRRTSGLDTGRIDAGRPVLRRSRRTLLSPQVTLKNERVPEYRKTRNAPGPDAPSRYPGTPDLRDTASGGAALGRAVDPPEFRSSGIKGPAMGDRDLRGTGRAQHSTLSESPGIPVLRSTGAFFAMTARGSAARC